MTSAAASNRASSDAGERPRTVLVTGAGGFIGGRVVEALHGSGLAAPRAGVRRWASAARIGRLPVEIVQCDVMDAAQVRAAMDGVWAVVHCAYGAPDVTIEGTRHVMQAAVDAGVERVVHLSTMDVYGQRSGALADDEPYGYTGSAYGNSKIEAEQVVREFSERGLAVAVLRPTIVYGPFSDLWVTSYAGRFRAGSWPFPAERCGGTCNLVHVDDLVQAIFLALTREEAVGEAFNINGADRPTWYEYFRALNDALGMPELAAGNATASRLRVLAMRPTRAAATWGYARFGGPVRSIAGRFPLAKGLLGRAEQTIKAAPSDGEFVLYGKRVSVSTEKAERLLGYRPAVSMEEGVRLTALWLKHHGYAPSRAADGAPAA